MADNLDPHGSDALDKLAARVAAVKQVRGERESKVAIDRSGMSLGLRMGSEFASAILVGGLLGYGVDFLAKSSPWGLLAGLVLGFVTGTVNIVRAARKMAAANPVDRNAPKVLDDEDEDL
jgi:ATP synthase protein I